MPTTYTIRIGDVKDVLAEAPEENKVKITLTLTATNPIDQTEDSEIILSPDVMSWINEAQAAL